MKHSHPIDASHQKAKDARELQARLYREIGISAVAAALQFTTMSDAKVVSKDATGISVARENSLAA